MDFAVFKGMILDANTQLDPKPRLLWQIVNNGVAGLALTNKDLSIATLTNVNFNGTKLNGANLNNTDLRDADIRGANFTGANLTFVDFRGTLMDGTTTIDAKSRLTWQIPQSGWQRPGSSWHELEFRPVGKCQLEQREFEQRQLQRLGIPASQSQRCEFSQSELQRRASPEHHDDQCQPDSGHSDLG